MQSQKDLEEMMAAGELIVTALNKDVRRNKKDRHAEYRTKRIAEATSLWQDYQSKLQALQKKMDPDDPCLQELIEKYKSAYKTLTDRILAIPTEDKKESEDEETNEEIHELISIQFNRMTKIKKLIVELKAKMDAGEVPEASYVAIKKQRIQDLWKKMEDDDDRIDQQMDPRYQQAWNETEKSVEEALIFLQHHTQPSPGPQGVDGLKLNRLEIQKFGGDYFKWVTFRDLFETMVIQNRNLSKAQKMQMLKTHIYGEPEGLINDLIVSEATFDSAWQRLNNRYNNSRVVVYKLLTKVINQPSCRNDSKSIKKLLDTTDQILMALKNLNRPIEKWDDWIIVVLTQKLGDECHKDWERCIGNTNALPTWLQLKEFLEEQLRLFERVESNHKRTEQRPNNSGNHKQLKAFHAAMEKNCSICNETHSLHQCQKWKSMTPKERFGVVKKNKWCKKCLRTHESFEERQACDKTCKKCRKGHSTWLHENRDQVENNENLLIAHNTLESSAYQVLLATAMVKTYDTLGQPITLRVLIDSGAEGSLITERAAALLNTKRVSSDKWLHGLTGHQSEPLKKIHLKIEPRFESKFFIELDFYILKKLTKMLPGHNLNTSSWKHIQKLVWADPNFHKSGPVDMLLGMDAIVDILKSRIVKGLHGQAMAQETKLGWIMSGKIEPEYPINEMKCLVTRITDVTEDLTKFWELEEINPERELTTEEIKCENLYVSSVKVDQTGEYIVEIPFKSQDEGPARLGESKGQAIARFLQVERRSRKCIHAEV